MLLQVHPRQWENKKICQASCNCNIHQPGDIKHSSMGKSWKVACWEKTRWNSLRPPPCCVLQLHPKLNLRDVSLIPATKERKKELTTSRDYSTFSQLCFLGRWVAMQLFDGNYNHRDTIGTPKHEISAWETGLSERWYILVDLFFW